MTVGAVAGFFFLLTYEIFLIPYQRMDNIKLSLSFNELTVLRCMMTGCEPKTKVPKWYVLARHKLNKRTRKAMGEELKLA